MRLALVVAAAVLLLAAGAFAAVAHEPPITCVRDGKPAIVEEALVGDYIADGGYCISAVTP